MRIKPWQTLIAILLLTLAAVWVDLPGQTLDPFGWKSGITVQQGLDLQGGIQIVLEARPPAGVEVTQDVLQGTRDTIERRVNGLGVSEPVIQTRGSNQILVELPGYRDPEQAVRVLQRTALLEIIDSPDERARRAQNAHQRVLESFTVQPQVAKIEAILQQVARVKR